MAIFQRGQVWWVKFQYRGKEIRQSARTKSRAEAKRFERELRRQLERDEHASRFGLSLDRTFEQGLLQWIESGAPKSMASHMRVARAYLGPVPLTQIVPAAHEMKKAMLADGLSPQTINRRLSVVRRILNLAYKEWGWLSEPLGSKIQMLSEKGTERHIYLSREEVTQILEHMTSDVAKQVTLLAAYTGLRRGEILRLTPDQWRKPVIRLDARTKGKRARTIPVVDELHEVLGSLPFDISEYELRKNWEQAREAVQMPHVRFHDLRHTFASWLAEDPDVPLTVLRDILGHSSLAVTSRYSHLRTEALTQAIKGLNKK